MKTVLLFLATLVAYLPAAAQIVLEWERSFGDSASHEARGVAQTADSGFVLTPFRLTNWEFELMRTNAQGDSLWLRTYTHTGADRPEAVVPTSDGGYLMVGRSEHGLLWGWAIKTDSDGDTLWTRQLGWGYDMMNAALETPDGGYLLAGHGHLVVPYCRGWLVKLTADGDTAWTRTYSGQNGGYFQAMCQTPDGGYVMSGISTSSNEEPLWLFKVNAEGDSLWSRTYPCISHGRSISVTRDGGFIVTSFRSDNSQNHLAVLRTDAIGDTLWCRVFQSRQTPGCGAVELTNDDFIVIGGNSYHDASHAPYVHLIRLNADGDSLAGFTMENVFAYRMISTMDGGYAVAGFYAEAGSTNSRIWLAKFAADSAEAPDVASSFIPHPSSFTLSAYPNPFNPTTQLGFSLPQAEQVQVEVMDVLGRCVAVLHDGLLCAGEHTVMFDGAGLAAGIYFARAVTPHHQTTQKLMLLK